MKATLARAAVALAIAMALLLLLASIRRDCATLAARAEGVSGRQYTRFADRSARGWYGRRGPLPRSVHFESRETWETYRARYLALREKRERRGPSHGQAPGRADSRSSRSPR
jgi:hypothetical protein